MTGLAGGKVPPELTGEITYRRLDHWITLYPQLFTAGARDPGQGHRRDYTPRDIATLRRLARLRRAGLTLRAAATITARDAVRGTWITPHVYVRCKTSTPPQRHRRPTLRRPARRTRHRDQRAHPPGTTDPTQPEPDARPQPVTWELIRDRKKIRRAELAVGTSLAALWAYHTTGPAAVHTRAFATTSGRHGFLYTDGHVDFDDRQIPPWAPS